MLLAAFLACMVVNVDLLDPSAPAGLATTHVFSDGDRTLAVIRGAARGHDDERVPAWLIDVATDRKAAVMLGHTVIARASELRPDDDVIVVRALMPSIGMVLIESTREEDAAELAARLSVDNRRIYPNLEFRMRTADVAAPEATPIPLPPDDPRYSGQFYFEEIGIEDAWRVSAGSPDVTVVVADNGCDLAHPDLLDKLDPGFDPFDLDGDPSFEPGEGNEHGTACAGIIGASTNNGTDIAGACPLCRLRCARLLPAEGEGGALSSDVDTFQFALTVDADIVSNSWGFVEAIPVPGPLKDAIVEVATAGRGGKGAIVVFASGNDSRIITDDELLAVEGVIGVGAVNSFGELTQFSNGGGAVDVVAPTGSTTTDISGAGGADPGDVTTTFGGTSSACPIVAGVAGLMLAHDPELTAAEVNDALIGSAKQSIFATPNDAGHDDFYGFGLVQPANALAFFDPPLDPPPPGGCGCSSVVDVAPLAIALLALRRRRRA